MLSRSNRKAAAPCVAVAGRARVLVSALLLGATILNPAAITLAQQEDAPLSRLRDQIAAMKKVDEDANASAEVRRVNREFLNERRRQMHRLLEGKADALRKYIDAVGAHLDAAEKVAVGKEISALGAEMRQLETEIGGSPRGTASSGLASAAPASAGNPQGDASAPADPAHTPGAVAPATSNVSSARAAAQVLRPSCYTDAPQPLVQTARGLAQLVVETKDPATVSGGSFDIMVFTVAHAVALDADLSEEERSFLNTIDVLRAQEETRRTDKQIGASARAEGSTSAAEKPGFADLLSFAVEHGAIQRSVNGTTLTLSASPYTLFLAGRDDTSTAYRKNSDLSRLNLSASFNIDDEDDPLASARRKQLAEWSAKLRLSGDRSARSFAAQQKWDTRVRTAFAGPGMRIERAMLDLFRGDRALEAKRVTITDRFTAPDFAQQLKEVAESPATPAEKEARVTELIVCKAKTEIFDRVRSGALRFDEATKRKLIRETLPGFKAALDERDKVIAEFEDELRRLREASAFTFAYTNKREAMGSDFSTFKLLYQNKTSGGLNIVANAGVSIYHRPDSLLNQQRLRDFSAALSFEGEAGRSPFLFADLDESRITYAFTGRYQRMLENRGIAGKKADIAVAQFRVEVPFMTGLSFPFSVTYANATELVKEDHVRANFGFSLDTDKLFTVIKTLGGPRVQ